MRYDLPELCIANQANLVDVLFEQIEARGLLDKPFLRSDKITLTYADASARINCMTRLPGTKPKSSVSTCAMQLMRALASA